MYPLRLLQKSSLCPDSLPADFVLNLISHEKEKPPGIKIPWGPAIF
jgi:hypothetical protein